MRVLVTGATGFLGHAVVGTLADHGHVVTALSRQASGVPAKADQHIRADICTAADVADAVSDVDAVCHLAALVRARESFTDPLAYWRTNVGGTLNLLEALAGSASPKRLVLASTGAIYGVPEKQPIAETAYPDPRSPYAATKLAADLAAANVAATGGLGAISLRAFNIAGAFDGFSDHDESRLIPKIVAVQAGRAAELVVNGDGSVVRDFVHVADMAEAVLLALDACAPGTWRVFNIGSGQRTTVRDVIAAAELVTGRPVRIRQAPPANEVPVLLADASRAVHELGWRPARSDLTTIVRDAWSAATSQDPS